MERSHVKMCANDYLSNKRYKSELSRDELISKVADSLQYFPKGSELFSTSGCKRLAQKIDILLEEEMDKIDELERTKLDRDPL